MQQLTQKGAYDQFRKDFAQPQPKLTVDPKNYLSKISVVCVVDPKRNERAKRLQKTANLEYNSLSKKFDLVYVNGQAEDAHLNSFEQLSEESGHKKMEDLMNSENELN